jgi:uncharacterized membrane protein
MNWFLVLKSIHVLSAIIAVGANLTYGVWSVRGQRDPPQLGFALRGIKFIDDRIANPAYGALLISGLLMARFYLGFEHAWILTGLAIFAVVAAIAIVLYSPTLARQIQALDGEGIASQAYRDADARARVLGMVMGALVIAAVFVMVFKPEV